MQAIIITKVCFLWLYDQSVFNGFFNYVSATNSFKANIQNKN